MMLSDTLVLSHEAACRILKQLSIEEACEFLSGSLDTNDGTIKFNPEHFRILPLTLTNESLDQATAFIQNQPCRFLKAIVIRIDNTKDIDSEKLEERLVFILMNAFKVSSKLDTITICCGRDKYEPDTNGNNPCNKIVARAICTTLRDHTGLNLKIRLQNIRLSDCPSICKYGTIFLDQVHSIEVLFEAQDKTSELLQKLLYVTTKLKEISLMNETGRQLSQGQIRKIMDAITTTTLEIITFGGLTTSANELQGILHPFKSSLRKLKLQNIMFQELSFKKFIHYIYHNFRLEELILEDIWERQSGELGFEWEISDPMSYWRSLH
ncbi:hypothetical protein F5884DRAFT_837988 [Xylogone sp. PMI_703]|nr:hypothetical protein F5884DRAFT_837988 [Xylogone sp. PMI_703]